MSTRKKKGDYVVHDRFFLEAKRLGYRARSAFKLIELQERFDLVKTGMRVLDLASAPGSFLQVLSKSVGPTWIVIGMDIQRMEALGNQNVRTFQCDVFDKVGMEKSTKEALEWFKKRRTGNGEGGDSEIFDDTPLFDVITSDIAPATTGMTGVDQYRSIELNVAVLETADVFLKKGGHLILKVFVGEDVDELVAPAKARFLKLQRFKPKACRDRSFEEYFICLGKK